MQFSFTIAGPPPVDVLVERDSFTGKFTCAYNGQTQELASVLNPFTYFNLKLEKVYTVIVGDQNQYNVTIKHIRPLFLAGFRPHRFQVWVDGQFYLEHLG